VNALSAQDEPRRVDSLGNGEIRLPWQGKAIERPTPTGQHASMIDH
jgi:hypothetical protein